MTNESCSGATEMYEGAAFHEGDTCQGHQLKKRKGRTAARFSPNDWDGMPARIDAFIQAWRSLSDRSDSIFELWVHAGADEPVRLLVSDLDAMLDVVSDWSP